MKCNECEHDEIDHAIDDPRVCYNIYCDCELFVPLVPTWKKYFDEMNSLTDKITCVMKYNPDTREYTNDQWIKFFDSNSPGKYASESITRSKRKVLELHPDWKSDELVEHQESKTRGIKEWIINLND